ncbi:hypothetical protein AXF42_Ash004058 [Apostasia shenzhenica]|uniref:OCEL domain-containing protein n=1 Tax=Apostasia shenzhenica TaxID=1088818 RepID=A0A2I0A1V2_9ASPA|nr:hypothetical protein AXF42_Ash004058 [Apostasia shenzhenica]
MVKREEAASGYRGAKIRHSGPLCSLTTSPKQRQKVEGRGELVGGAAERERPEETMEFKATGSRRMARRKGRVPSETLAQHSWHHYFFLKKGKSSPSLLAPVLPIATQQPPPSTLAAGVLAMFKLGRGGKAGRGSAKRLLSTPAQLLRSSAPAGGTGARLPIGASAPGRVRPSASAAAGSAGAVAGREETFRLEPGVLDFGAIIRLTPDLVEEIRRLEAQGGTARIRFDANVNISAGNVIDVGGKEFRFTWARESTDLCDIYEEQQNGEDGDGLLVECGSASRKLNVQRILDESTKNHVKMRSEEAERMSKSRKAIVLDPTNPSVKSQAKSLVAAAVEGNMRRMGWKQKEMFYKKRRVEANHGAVVAQPKTSFKSATPSSGNLKGRPSSSPVSSSPDHPRPRAPVSPSGRGNFLKADAKLEESIIPVNMSKEEIDIFEKEMPTGVARGSMQEINGYKERNAYPPSDLQSILIALLSQNPKGMSLKALEKAVGENAPNSVKMIENALKNVATFQAPGRYYLKQGAKIGSSRKSSELGSSPESSNNHISNTASTLAKKTSEERMDQETKSSPNHEGSDPFEKIDIMQDTEDPLYIDGKTKDDTKKRACSSSESGSGSDTETNSSDSGCGSGSPSRSRSKSRSPTESGASSSDSESDGSSSSKEASDVDVDIMISDDEKGVDRQNNQANESRLYSDELHIDTTNRTEEANAVLPPVNLNDFASNHGRDSSIEDTKSSEIPEIKIANSIDSYQHASNSRLSAENWHVSIFGNSDNHMDRLSGRNVVNAKQNLMTNRSGYELIEAHEKFPQANSKRSFNSEYSQEKHQNFKKIKALNSAELSLSSAELARSAGCGSTNRVQKSPNYTVDLNLDVEQAGRKVNEFNGRKKGLDSMENPVKYTDIIEKTKKNLETASGPQESEISAVKNMLFQEKVSAAKGKKEVGAKILKESTAEKLSSLTDQSSRKSIEGYLTDVPNSDLTGKGNVLRREVSDLELGEFREPFGDETEEVKKQFDRKGSFKKVENNLTVSDPITDTNINRSEANTLSELKQQSPSNFRGGLNAKVPIDDNIDLSANSLSRVVQHLSQQSSRKDITESENVAYLDKNSEWGSRNEMRTDQTMGAENQADGPKKIAVSRVQKDDNTHASLVARKNTKESTSHKSNGFEGFGDRGFNGSLTDNGIDTRKSMEFSSDEEGPLCLKYDKEEPDCRGPIKDFLMYKEYVKEYQEKYSHYCFLNKKLEKNRNDFLKVGDDIQLAKSRNMSEYNSLVEKLKQMYLHSGERHKQMKRIFFLLHEELQTLKQRIKDFAQLHSG